MNQKIKTVYSNSFFLLCLFFLQNIWCVEGALNENNDIESKSENDTEQDLSSIYLGEYLHPWEGKGSEDLVEFLFDNAELSVLLQYVEKVFHVSFILDDTIQPVVAGGKNIVGTKISFRTHKPLKKQEAWNLFLAFLDMTGLAPVPGPNPRVYRLMPSQDPKSPYNVTRAPLPTFIGVEPDLIPNNDTRIRYVYFVENASLDVVKNVLDSMKSSSSPNLIIMPELNGIIITEKAANIKMMLATIRELDQANMPEALAFIQLKRADAVKAAQLYEALAKKESQGFAARILGARRQSTTEYFSEGAKVIPEPRTNRLIVLGSHESIKKISEFIRDIVDRQDSLPEIPLYVYRLKFLDAESIASILQQATQFQSGSDASKMGGVRDGDKYLKSVSITAEKTTNSIIINADYEDYSKIFELLQKIDVEQPQVALKVFILNIDLTDSKGLGTQFRNKRPGVTDLIGKNTSFQTSGLANVNSGIVENAAGTGSTRLLGDLVKIASSVNSLGSTVLSLGSDSFGVWGILNMLDTYTSSKLIANPFLVTTHKYPAQFTIGEKRYVVTSTVFSTTGPQNTFGYVDANLTVNITPQISKDGLITLAVKIYIDQFEDSTITSQNGNRSSRRIDTTVIVADNEVLALGGLLKETTRTTISGIPILSKIPFLKWLFENKTNVVEKNSLLILIVPEVIKTSQQDAANLLTRSKLLDAQNILKQSNTVSQPRDPINRWFFKDNEESDKKIIDSFVRNENRFVVDDGEALQQKSVFGIDTDTSEKIKKIESIENSQKKDDQGIVKKSSLLDVIPD